MNPNITDEAVEAALVSHDAAIGETQVGLRLADEGKHAPVKLTKSLHSSLNELCHARGPLDWRYNNKAKGNKLVRMGYAQYWYDYPHGFVITLAGRAALDASDD